jgi:hypothetical protein
LSLLIKRKESPADSPILSDEAGTFLLAPSKMAFGSFATFPFLSFRARRQGVAPANSSLASFDTVPVGSTTHIEHSLLQPAILVVPSCPRALILVAGVTSKSASFPYHSQCFHVFSVSE